MMSRKQYIDIARQAGFKVTEEGKLIIYGEGYLKPHYEGKIVDGIKAAIDIATAREREKFCVVLRQLHDSYSLTSDSNAIRARGQE